jgi:hypothetical protein
MKKKNLFYLMAVVFTACNPLPETQTILVDFENVKLTADSISGGTSFVSGNSTFKGDPAQFWNGGVVCSAKIDTVTGGYANQYSCMAGSGALLSRHFGVVYTPASFTCKDNIYFFGIKSMMVTNTTYAYRDIQTGTPGVSKKFADGDWFKLTITGYKTKIKTGSVDFYLADFRNGKTNLLRTWQKIDLVTLGMVDSIAFSVDSSDKGQWGVNTPTYVCIDNIEFNKILATPL